VHTQPWAYKAGWSEGTGRVMELRNGYRGGQRIALKEVSRGKTDDVHALGRQQAWTRHGEGTGLHRGLRAGHGFGGATRELGRATCCRAKVAGLGSRLTQEPWHGPGGRPSGHEPERDTTNRTAAGKVLRERAPSEAPQDGQGGRLSAAEYR
jgi:hypothetical protein